MAALLIDAKREDEIILPSYTFVSTANAFALRNATIIFADIEDDTLNIDPCEIEQKITEKTKAIVPVHYAGIACRMDEIMNIASQHNLSVIEDAAQGVNAKFGERYLGTIGTIGCYSFHETKNYICGEGGAILINNPDLIERAEVIREKGTNRNKFFRGEIDKYTWIDVGSGYIGSDLLAAYLWAQLKMLNEIQLKRKHIFESYYKGLEPLEEKGLLRLPRIPEYCSQNYHMFYILMPDEISRNQLIEYLMQKEIQAIFHYVPLHLSPMGHIMGYKKGDLPITESVASRIIRLPFYNDLSDADIARIISTIQKKLLA